MFEDKVNVYINSKNRAANETVSNFNVVIPDSLLLLHDKNEYWTLNVNFFSCFNNWYNCMKDFNDEFELKGTPKEDTTDSEKLNFLQYLYGNLMQGFVDNDESLKEKIRFFVNKKDICNGYSCYDESYALPKLVKNIFSFQYLKNLNSFNTKIKLKFLYKITC